MCVTSEVVMMVSGYGFLLSSQSLYAQPSSRVHLAPRPYEGGGGTR